MITEMLINRAATLLGIRFSGVTQVGKESAYFFHDPQTNATFKVADLFVTRDVTWQASIANALKAHRSQFYLVNQ